MSRAALTVQSFAVAGGSLTFSAPNGTGAGNGNTIASTSPRLLLLVNNTNGSSRTITLVGVSATYYGLTQASTTFTLPGTTTCYAIWLIPALFASGGSIAVDIDTTTGVTWAAVELPAGYQ